MLYSPGDLSYFCQCLLQINQQRRKWKDILMLHFQLYSTLISFTFLGISTWTGEFICRPKTSDNLALPGQLLHKEIFASNLFLHSAAILLLFFLSSGGFYLCSIYFLRFIQLLPSISRQTAEAVSNVIVSMKNVGDKLGDLYISICL